MAVRAPTTTIQVSTEAESARMLKLLVNLKIKGIR